MERCLFRTTSPKVCAGEAAGCWVLLTTNHLQEPEDEEAICTVGVGTGKALHKRSNLMLEKPARSCWTNGLH